MTAASKVERKEGEAVELREVAVVDHTLAQHHLLPTDDVHVDVKELVSFTRPAVDPLFISAAKAFGDRVVGIVLSGGDGDEAEGLQAATKHGGRAFVQNPEEAMVPSMPYTALMSSNQNGCLPTTLLAKRMSVLCR